MTEKWDGKFRPEDEIIIAERKRRVNELIAQGKYTITSSGVVIVNEAIEETPLLFDLIMKDKMQGEQDGRD